MLVADDAFPLRENIMKPFSRRSMGNKERIFNYRLSRARRIVENAFGILASIFRVYKSPIAVKVATARLIVLATTTLHNFIRRNRKISSDSEDIVDIENLDSGVVVEGKWRSDIRQGALRQIRSSAGRVPSGAKQCRIQLTDYFVNEGAVE
jgi:hypothetical protein